MSHLPADLSRLSWEQLEALDRRLQAYPPHLPVYAAAVDEMFRRDRIRAGEYLRWRHLADRFHDPEDAT